MTEAGWYDDPQNPDRLRWWDGEKWTDNMRPNALPPPTSRPVATDPPDEAATSLTPPWAQSSENDDEDDEYEEYGDYDEEYDEEEDLEEGSVSAGSGPSLFDTAQRPSREEREDLGPEEQNLVPQRPPRTGPPIMERSPDSNIGGGGASRPAWQNDRAGSSEPRETPNDRRNSPLPPWLRSSEERSSSPGGIGSGGISGGGDGSNERPRPPWLRDSPSPRSTPSEGTPERSRSRRDDSFDDDDFMERRSRPEREEAPPRLASWEEMMEDFDEDSPGRFDQEKIKKYIFLGVGIAVGILVLYVAVQFFQGREPGDTEKGEEDPPIALVNIEGWSSWPDARGGYVVKFPNSPSYSGAADRSIWTSTVEKAVNDEAPQNEIYLVAQKFLDPSYVAAAAPQEREMIAGQFLSELYPGYTLGESETTTLAGAPARKVVLTADNMPSITGFFTLSESILIVVAANELAENDKFFDSFGWFRTPQLPPPPGR